jgi:isochorismate pyruvate lyase
VGYSRAVRAGNQVFVSGTTAALPDGGTFAPGDAYAQARRCFEVGIAAIRALGGEARHVTRTRMYVTDIGRWEEVARAHAEMFGEVRPAATMVEVARLIAPGLLVEVELEAVIDD